MNVSASGCGHLERILERFHGILVIAEFFIDFGKAVPGVHAVRVQRQSAFKMFLRKRPVAAFHVAFRKGKMHVVRFGSKFKRTVVRSNSITRRISEIVQIAKEHPRLHEIRKQFDGSLVRDHRHFFFAELHKGVAQVEPRKRFIAAVVNRRTVILHRFLVTPLVVKFVRLEEEIVCSMQR